MKWSSWIVMLTLLGVGAVRLGSGLAAKPSVLASLPTWRGDFCVRDADCAWDNPCVPQRCGKVKPGPKQLGCDKGTSPRGSCTCVEHQCTLRPSNPRTGDSSPSPAGCRSDDDCAVDLATATCHLKGNRNIGAISVEGPLCTCNQARRQCEYQWIVPVPCKSWKDCWWKTSPRLHPIRAPKPRLRKLRPCKDGEHDSICHKGRCMISGWEC